MVLTLWIQNARRASRSGRGVESATKVPGRNRSAIPGRDQGQVVVGADAAAREQLPGHVQGRPVGGRCAHGRPRRIRRGHSGPS